MRACLNFAKPSKKVLDKNLEEENLKQALKVVS